MKAYPVVYCGFDGLDASFRVTIPDDLCEALEAAQTEARAKRREVRLVRNDIDLFVAETGSQGGYAFKADTGPRGEKWFVKRRNRMDPWGVSVSVKSLTLAVYGLDGVIRRLHDRLAALGMPTSERDVSIRRVDYAIDVLAPGFELVPTSFVTHSRVGREEFPEPSAHSISRRYIGFRAGKMPGRQICMYDKRTDVIKKKKLYWWTIWNRALAQQGLPALSPKEAQTSRVWRIEVRAGKAVRGADFRLRTWSDLYREAQRLFADIVSAIRLTTPTSDSNRSRWPDHPIWQLVRQEIAEGLTPCCGLITPDEVDQLTADQKIEMLTTHIVGTTASVTALKTNVDDEVACARQCLRQIGSRISADSNAFSRKVEAARERHRL